MSILQDLGATPMAPQEGLEGPCLPWNLGILGVMRCREHVYLVLHNGIPSAATHIGLPCCVQKWAMVVTEGVEEINNRPRDVRVAGYLISGMANIKTCAYRGTFMGIPVDEWMIKREF